jgi:transcriptional regulator with XRE-family HTH domain
MTEQWRSLLRQNRKRLGLSQSRVGYLCGLSPETVRKYENGARNPSRQHLSRILETLQVPQAEAKAILQGAGFSAPELFPLDRYPNYYFSRAELQEYVDGTPWPQFVLNNFSEVVAANRLAQALWGVDLAVESRKRRRAQLNLLAIAAEQRFAERVRNWDECLATLVAVFKGLPQGSESLDKPGPYFQEVLAHFASGDPEFLSRLMDVWSVTPAREAKCRWAYSVHWSDPRLGEMRFHCLVSTASEPEGLSFNDWVPVDAGSWSRLEQVKERLRA